MKRLICAGLAALTLSGCHRSAPALDLSCDVIRADAVPDLHRMETRYGTRADSVLLSRGHGQILVRAFDHRDSARLDRPLRAVLTNTDTGTESARSAEQLDGTFDTAAGAYSLYVTCLGCSRSRVAVTVAPGRVDTVDAYLTRFPRSCVAGDGTNEVFEGVSLGQ